MKKALFIDRDGTIIAEPADEQIDSLEKLAFVPGAISALKALTGLGFDLVLATNQDGLGTDSFPEDTFWPAHEKMLSTLRGEGVAFDDQLIDRTFEADAAPTRKPRTGMFGRSITPPVSVARRLPFLRATVAAISLSWPVPSITIFARMFSGSTCIPSRNTGVQFTTTPLTVLFLKITSSTE